MVLLDLLLAAASPLPLFNKNVVGELMPLDNAGRQSVPLAFSSYPPLLSMQLSSVMLLSVLDLGFSLEQRQLDGPSCVVLSCLLGIG